MEQQGLAYQAKSFSGAHIIPRLEDVLPGLHLFIALDCPWFEFEWGQEIFLFLQNVQTSSGAQPVTNLVATGFFFPRDKAGWAQS
jgi:hypothetical protein